MTRGSDWASGKMIWCARDFASATHRRAASRASWHPAPTPNAVLLLLRLWQGPYVFLGQQKLDPWQPFELVAGDGNHLRTKPEHSANVDLDGLDLIVGSFYHLDNLPEVLVVGAVDLHSRQSDQPLYPLADSFDDGLA